MQSQGWRFRQRYDSGQRGPQVTRLNFQSPTQLAQPLLHPADADAKEFDAARLHLTRFLRHATALVSDLQDEVGVLSF